MWVGGLESTALRMGSHLCGPWIPMDHHVQNSFKQPNTSHFVMQAYLVASFEPRPCGILSDEARSRVSVRMHAVTICTTIGMWYYGV